MNPFLEHLPWRVASLAGLMVGAISLATGTDAWACLMRVGAAFILFGALGVGLRTVLGQGVINSPPSASPRTADHRGQRFDQTTPEDGADTNVSASPNANDVK